MTTKYTLILISHYDISTSIKEALFNISRPSVNVAAYGIYDDTDLSALQRSIELYAEEQQKGGTVIVLTDIILGTPFNMSAGICRKLNLRHIVGMSLPLIYYLAEELKQNDKLDEAIENALEKTRKATADVNRLLGI